VTNTKFAALGLALTLGLAAPALAQDDKAPQRPAPSAQNGKSGTKPAQADQNAGAKPAAAAQKKAGQAAKPQAEPAKAELPAVAPGTATPTPSALVTAPPANTKPAGAQREGDAPSPVKLDRAEAIKRANAFFNASPVMTADFVQIGADGKRSEGKLHVQRAGRVRFEYAEPATMEVISDGARVLVRDRKLKTQDLYFIDQTPLKFLMKEKIDLEKDVKVLNVTIEDFGATIAAEDSATFGGTSHLKLIFDPKTFILKQWQITDPQGYETLLSLFNVDQKSAPDPALFKIDQKSKID
jgi:outer membrane lipoprotein-sorting protein